jgi:hypothetical protein
LHGFDNLSGEIGRLVGLIFEITEKIDRKKQNVHRGLNGAICLDSAGDGERRRQSMAPAKRQIRAMAPGSECCWSRSGGGLECPQGSID